MSELNQVLGDFGRVLRAQRKQLGISQEELAFRSGLHRTYVTDVERGLRNMTLESVLKITRALELPFVEAITSLGIEEGRSPERTVGKHANGNGTADILIVEDDADDALLTTHALRRNGITNRVASVATGKDALNIFAGHDPPIDGMQHFNPELLLLDLRLPDIDGIELLRQLRSDPRTRSLHVVILTASRSDEDRSRCMALGVSDYITKPVNFIEFHHLLTRMGFGWMVVRHEHLITSHTQARAS